MNTKRRLLKGLSKLAFCQGKNSETQLQNDRAKSISKTLLTGSRSDANVFLSTSHGTWGISFVDVNNVQPIAIAHGEAFSCLLTNFAENSFGDYNRGQKIFFKFFTNKAT